MRKFLVKVAKLVALSGMPPIAFRRLLVYSARYKIDISDATASRSTDGEWSVKTASRTLVWNGKSWKTDPG